MYVETQNSRRSGPVDFLQSRISILLGLGNHPTESLTRGFTEARLDLTTDSSPRSGEKSSLPEPANLRRQEDILGGSFQPVPPREPEPDPAPGFRNPLYGEIDYLRAGVLSDTILRNGIFLDRYRVATQNEGSGFPVVFRQNARELWRQIASYPTQEEAIRAVNNLRRLLIRLSVNSEGLHIIEHLLLRPLGSSGLEALADPEAQREFYSFKLSVFFPSWTARFNDPGFRRLAETTVGDNCPAHVHPECYWLDFPQMRRLEELRQRWLADRNHTGSSPEETDKASQKLAQFILDLRGIPTEPVADETPELTPRTRTARRKRYRHQPRKFQRRRTRADQIHNGRQRKSKR